ncbi:MAG: hypothetical protein WDM92_11365 [Caulobacteraceae bacterium]
MVSLLAAALVYIAIVLLLPRPTPEIYRMSDIEQLLAGGRAPAAVSRQLIVRITTKAPGRDRGALYGRVEQHLARDLGISADEVRFQPLASRVLLELPPSAFRSHRGRCGGGSASCRLASRDRRRRTAGRRPRNCPAS